MRSLLLTFLLLIGLFSLSSCALIPSNVVYLLPDGYAGGVIVVFDQSDGVDADVQGRTTTFSIPADGLLRVRGGGVSGSINKSYFWQRKDGTREEITYLQITGNHSPQGLPQNKFGNISMDQYENKLYVMNAGGLGSFNVSGRTIQYTSFVVSTPRNNTSVYIDMNSRVHQLVKELQMK